MGRFSPSLLWVGALAVATAFAPARFLAPAPPTFAREEVVVWATAEAPPTLTTTTTTKTVGVGVIGCGRIGLTHLEALSECPECVVHVVSNPTVAKAEAAAKKFGVARFCTDADEVINDPDTDAIWICSPSSTHGDLIRKCAAAGKHVFCEKPIAVDLPDTISAIRACKDANVKLMTALQRRFDPHFTRVKTAIESGEVGDTIFVKLCSRDPAPPPVEYVKGGGGIFKDMAVHDLDMARFLMGCEPRAILALGCNRIDPTIKALEEKAETFDTAAIMIRFENDKTAIIDVCRQSPYGYDQRAEVLGTKGMIMTENVYPSTAKLYLKDFTGNADMPYDFFMQRYQESYKLETKAFVDALHNDKPTPCTGEDGLIALIMAIAAGRSAAEKRWVKFSEIPEMIECIDGMCTMKDVGELAEMLTDPADEGASEDWTDKASHLVD